MRERAAAVDQAAEIRSLPVEERVEAGYCIDDLRFVRWERRESLLVLGCPANVSKFRAGERMRLGSGEAPAEGAAVVYLSYDPTSGLLRVEKDRWNLGGWEDMDLGGRLVLDADTSDFAETVLGAVETVFRGHDERASTIRAILEGTLTQTFDEQGKVWAEGASSRFGLDAFQKRAFVECVARRPFHLVQGPPGSGKTRLIASLVSVLGRAGRRTLVTAYTHRAVNNALRCIASLDPSLAIVKLGEGHHAEDLPEAVSRARSARSFLEAGLRKGVVVGGTLFSLKAFWEEAPFDLVVFDEAAQVPIPHAVCGMLAGRRYVFVGDHKQLGPIVVGDHEDDIASLSIFAHLIAGGRAGPTDAPAYPTTVLQCTYRMNEGITQFPGRHFYDGALRASDQSASRRFRATTSGPFEALWDPDRPAVVATIAHEGWRRRCLPEAELTAGLLVDYLVRQNGDPAQIAVVTPYRSQIRAIRDLLHRRLDTAPPRSMPELPVIDTVERMQGQEREVVIVSLVCSEPEYAAQEARFFFSPNRMNVTITRARTKLILIASPRLFEALPRSLDDLRNVSLYARLYQELPKIDFTESYVTRGSRGLA